MSAQTHFSDQENARQRAELVAQRDTARAKLASTTANLDRVLAEQRPWQEENEFLFQEILRLNRDVLTLRKDNLDLRRELTAMKSARIVDYEAEAEAAQEFEQWNGQNLADVHGPR